MTARDADGKNASLNIPLKVFSQATFESDSTLDRIVKRKPVVKIEESIQTSSFETDVPYRESKSESFGSSYGRNISPSATLQFGLNFVQMTTWNLAFGVDERTDINVSKETDKSVSQRVPPDHCTKNCEVVAIGNRED